MWNAAHAGVVQSREIPDATVFFQYLQVDPEFYRTESSQPVTVRVKVYLTNDLDLPIYASVGDGGVK